ncbi:hypothetical protein DXG03_003591 [Asterophora parasitica]|uniref:Peroxin-3 n=1 Tax=Asterophora parasitica TaxID=117018 RepID=A0A9P7KAP6_9AGAR|nr:hypothetical protein DXG03_003591 [Asterophora parasitica]
MFTAVKSFVSERRRGFTKAAAIAGGVYVVRGYVRDRLDEVKDRLEQERMARDNLKRRFIQTQDDVSFTVHALLQTLTDQILADMDVEGITLELQTRSKARHAARLAPQPPSESEDSASLASSIHVVQSREHEQHEDRDSARAISVSSVSALYHEDASSSTSDMASLGHSWVDASGSTTSGSASGSPQQPPRPALDATHTHEQHAPADTLAPPLGHRSPGSSVADSGLSDSMMSASITSDSSAAPHSNVKTAAELWNEVKILALTRTLTTLYATTLLALLTSTQLTLLARHKYVSSIRQLERDERINEALQSQFSLTSLLLSSVTGRGVEDLLSGDIALLEEGHGEGEGWISEDVESRFLTLSWWILHVGWKDVAERVRRAVEDVFEGVSLKSKLAPIDLHRLVTEVRRRVEHEVTFEGIEKRVDFLSSLLPPTPETVQHVLTQGGLPSHPLVHPLHPRPYDLLEFDDELLSASQGSFSHVSHMSYSYSNASDVPAWTNTDALGAPHAHHPQAASPWHPGAHQHQHHAAFNLLVAETRAVLASADFARVLAVCLDRATEVLFDGLEVAVFGPSAAAAATEANRVRLAGMLPGLAKWSREIGVGVPCVLVDGVLGATEVRALSAIVFARFEEEGAH